MSDSIYKIMNNIDDNESLSEQQNINNAQDRRHLKESVADELVLIGDAAVKAHQEEVRETVEVVKKLNPAVDTDTLTTNLLNKCRKSFVEFARKKEFRRNSWKNCNYDYDNSEVYLGAWYPFEVIQTIEDKIFVEVHVSMMNWIVARPVCVFENGENTFRDAAKSEYSSVRLVKTSIRVDN